EEVREFFVGVRGGGGSKSGLLVGSVAGIEGGVSLRRASSIRRAFTTGTASLKRKSRVLQVKFQTDGLIETLRRTAIHYVHCFLPQHNGGLAELRSSPSTPTTPTGTGDLASSQTLNIPLLRSQFRGAQLLDAVRLYKQGFPDSMAIPEFKRRFGLLSSQSNTSLVEDAAVTPAGRIEDVLAGMDLDPSSYRIGLTQSDLPKYGSATDCSNQEGREVGVILSCVRPLPWEHPLTEKRSGPAFWR
ncbi:unnamed protein product, partial [Cyprideis torosa]